MGISINETNASSKRFADRVERRLPAIYLAIALSISACLALLTPPFFIPDEINHAQREIEISHGQWEDHQGGGMIDANFLRVATDMGQVVGSLTTHYPIASLRPNGRISRRELDPDREVRWAGQTVFSPFANTSFYAPVLYLPAVVGWKIGEIANLTILRSLLLARLFAAAAAASLGWLALTLCRRGRWLLFMYLLLPTLLSLGASCSQDAVLLTATALGFAILGRALEDRRGLSGMECAVMTLLLVATTLARPPYLPVALVMLLPSLNVGSGWKRFVRPMAGVLVVTVLLGAWLWAMRGQVNAHGTFADPVQQKAFMLSHPVQGMELVIGGTLHEVPVLAVKGLYMLGINDVYPPLPVYVLLILILGILAWLATDGTWVRWPGRWILIIALLVTIAGISLAEIMTWTPVGANRIGGLQSRYFLPLVPFALLLFSRKEPRWRRSGLAEHLMLATVGVLVLITLSTPWLAARRFYDTTPVKAAELVLK